MIQNQLDQKRKDDRFSEFREDYQVVSKFVNGESMNYQESYPIIRRSIYDRDYLDPDQSEYCAANRKNKRIIKDFN